MFYAAAMVPVQAQTDDQLMLMSRLNDLESQVNSLQQHQGGGKAGSVAPGPAAADLDVRLSQLQEQVRSLTGQLETQENEIAQLKAENQRSSTDLETRLTDLETKAGGAAAPAGPAAQQSMAPASLPVPLTAPAAGGETLGTLSNSSMPSSGSPEKDYEAAYNLLGTNDYDGAARDFSAFLQHYPKHPLAANAQYWLGETYYARNQFPEASAQFAQSYKLYPNGSKAPDSLLKLGMSLGQQGQTAQACLSFTELARQFPAASQKIKTALTQERARYKCQ